MYRDAATTAFWFAVSSFGWDWVFGNSVATGFERAYFMTLALLGFAFIHRRDYVRASAHSPDDPTDASPSAPVGLNQT